MRIAMLSTLLLAATALPAQTVEQKAAQLQNAAPADPALGLPAYDWWNEGLHGLARDERAGTPIR